MKYLPALITLSIFLVSCANQNPTPQIIEVTRIVEVTQAVTPQTTPTPNVAQMLFPADCLTPQPGVDYRLYKLHNFKMIGLCSFIEPSPDGRYLAYSTMTCESGPTPPVCGEAVKVFELNSQEEKLVYLATEKEKKLVSGLAWSSTGDLVIIRTDINSPIDTWVISWPPPSTKKIIPGGVIQWNASRSAFFTDRGAGPGACGGIVSGFDFTSRKVFPDIAASLGLDTVNIEVYRNIWWEKDSSILLLITPMVYDEQKQDDKFLPTIAGKITLTPLGPEYNTIASSATEDFYFVDTNDGGFSVQSKPYKVHYCFGG
jgi:hypothetical protein